MALITPLLIIISPPLSKPRLSIAAELFVVTVTSALIEIVPFTVPIQVLVDVALTVLLIVIPFSAAIATFDDITLRGALTVTENTSIA